MLMLTYRRNSTYRQYLIHPCLIASFATVPDHLLGDEDPYPCRVGVVLEDSAQNTAY